MKVDLDVKKIGGDKKSKLIMVITAVCFIYVIWTVYGFFSGKKTDTSKTYSGTENSKRLNKKMSGGANGRDGDSQGLSTTVDYSGNSASSSSVDFVQRHGNYDSSLTISDSSRSDASSDMSAAYEKLMRGYQLLKIKRMLWEEKLAISAARQKIAELDAKTSDFGGNMELEEEGDNVYDSVVNDNFGGSSSVGGASSNNQTNVPEAAYDAKYKVIYIDKQNGEWNATVVSKGKFEEINVGSRLNDGSEVLSISAKEVLLKKGSKEIRVTFAGSVVIGEISNNEKKDINLNKQVQPNDIASAVSGDGNDSRKLPKISKDKEVIIEKKMDAVKDVDKNTARILDKPKDTKVINNIKNDSIPVSVKTNQIIQTQAQTAIPQVQAAPQSIEVTIDKTNSGVMKMKDTNKKNNKIVKLAMKTDDKEDIVDKVIAGVKSAQKSVSPGGILNKSNNNDKLKINKSGDENVQKISNTKKINHDIEHLLSNDQSQNSSNHVNNTNDKVVKNTKVVAPATMKTPRQVDEHTNIIVQDNVKKTKEDLAAGGPEIIIDNEESKGGK